MDHVVAAKWCIKVKRARSRHSRHFAMLFISGFNPAICMLIVNIICVLHFIFTLTIYFLNDCTIKIHENVFVTEEIN